MRHQDKTPGAEMKPLVIYHANCTDGFGAAFAAWLKLGDEAEYLPTQYGKINNDHDFIDTFGWVDGRNVYVLDLSFPREVMDALFWRAKRVVWLDHHKTAFEMWCGEYYKGMQYDSGPESPDISYDHHILLDDNKSGALLAWEYFHPGTEVPRLIQHIDDRDRWQFKLDGSRELHAVLTSLKPWSFGQWSNILAETSYRANDGTGIDALYRDGAVLLRSHKQQVKSALKQARPCRLLKSVPKQGGEHWEALFPVDATGLAANAPFDLASTLGHELSKKSGTFGLVWSLAADGQIHCSLRSNGEYDVSAIAKAFDGGGHRNAAGFSTNIETLMGWIKAHSNNCKGD